MNEKKNALTQRIETSSAAKPAEDRIMSEKIKNKQKHTPSA